MTLYLHYVLLHYFLLCSIIVNYVLTLHYSICYDIIVVYSYYIM